MLNLKLQYFGCLMWRADSLEKTLILEKVENRRRSGQQRMRWLDGIADSMDMDLGELQVTVRGREAWHAAVYGVAKSRTWLSDWATTKELLWGLEAVIHCLPAAPDTSARSVQGSVGLGAEVPTGSPLCLVVTLDTSVYARLAAVHAVAKSRTRLSDFTFTFHFHALEKEMATHSSVLAWRIPGTGEPGGLPSVGSHRVRHDWSDLAAAAVAVYARGWLRRATFTSGTCVY